ncbi:MAG: lipocalin family protein [Nitrospira sp.]|nr:lipocalin family protein [Nitrospira sp.]
MMQPSVRSTAHSKLWWSLALACAVLGGCAGIESRREVQTVAAVDLSRYAGTWYEIARLPMWFQRHCIDSKAIYTLRSDGTVGVHNECVTDAGERDQIEGVAAVVDARTNAKLNVQFDNWFARLFGSSREGNYWILDLDAEYRTALVGTPDRRYLWILSRTPQLEEPVYRRLVELSRGFGYRTDGLVRDRRP